MIYQYASHEPIMIRRSENTAFNCTCGWQGPEFYTLDAAMEQWGHHCLYRSTTGYPAYWSPAHRERMAAEAF